MSSVCAYLEMQLHPVSSAASCLSLILVGSEKRGRTCGKTSGKGCFSEGYRKLNGWKLKESKTWGWEEGPWIFWGVLEVFQILVYYRSSYYTVCFGMPFYMPG